MHKSVEIGRLSANVKNIDCRIGIREIDDNAVSLILTDPPYFIDGMGDDWDTKKLKSRVKEGVIGSLPVGMKFSVAQGRELQKFLTPIAEEWIRVLRPGGFCLVFSQNRLVHRTAMALEDVGFEIRDMLLWRYEGQAKPLHKIILFGSGKYRKQKRIGFFVS